MSICIIPARGGSTRIPHKNIKLFHGEPIICYSIEAAMKSQLFDRIVVSTDDKEIALVVNNTYTKKEVEIHWRDAEFCRNEVGTQAVMKHALESINYKGDFACCLYATAPLLNVNDLGRGFVALVKYDYSFTMSVGTDPLHDAGQFYFGDIEDFINEVPLIDENTGMIPIAKNRVCDINTPEDWARAEEMYRGLNPMQFQGFSQEQEK